MQVTLLGDVPKPAPVVRLACKQGNEALVVAFKKNIASLASSLVHEELEVYCPRSDTVAYKVRSLLDLTIPGNPMVFNHRVLLLTTDRRSLEDLSSYEFIRTQLEWLKGFVQSLTLEF